MQFLDEKRNDGANISRYKAETIIASMYPKFIPPSPVCSTNFTPRSRHTLVDKLHNTVSQGIPPTNERVNYLERHGTILYLRDLMKQLQEKKPTNIVRYVSVYFTSVMKGTNVVGREFEYIHSTVQNRFAFIRHLRTTFGEHVLLNGIGHGDFMELIRYECTDFPEQLMHQVCCHVTENTSFANYLSILSKIWIYIEFLDKMYHFYQQNEPINADKLHGIKEEINCKMLPTMVHVEVDVVESHTFADFQHRYLTNPMIENEIVEIEQAFQTLAYSFEMK